MKFHISVLAPNNIPVTNCEFLEIRRDSVLIVLRMRMFYEKIGKIYDSFCCIIETNFQR